MKKLFRAMRLAATAMFVSLAPIGTAVMAADTAGVVIDGQVQ